MAKQFSVPQKQVLKELDGESGSQQAPARALTWPSPGNTFTEGVAPGCPAQQAPCCGVEKPPAPCRAQGWDRAAGLG